MQPPAPNSLGALSHPKTEGGNVDVHTPNVCGQGNVSPPPTIVLPCTKEILLLFNVNFALTIFFMIYFFYYAYVFIGFQQHLPID